MEQYSEAYQHALHYLLGNPTDLLQFWLVLVPAYLLFTLILHKTADTMGTRGLTFFGASVPGICGLVLALAGGAAATIFLKDALSYAGLLALGMVLASALVVVPTLNALLRCGYMSLICSWIFALAGFVLVVLLVNGVFDFIESSGNFASREYDRKSELRELID
ncbi:MAG: hypothetical protein ACI9QL_000982 [Candidatus Omnitrophota bacterium]|jgi:hypothetical protein